MFVEKIKEPPPKPGPDGREHAMVRGDRIHRLGEAYVRGVLARMPPELKEFAALVRKLRAGFAKRAGVTIEETWAFRKDWTVTTWNDWDGCHLRVKVDVSYDEDTLTVAVVDWKTGKYSPEWNLEEYLLQVDLYAMAALIKHATRGPGLRVIPRLAFLDHGITHPAPGDEKVYTPADLPRLKREWEKRTRAMLNDRRFAPRPNRWCSTCHFRRDNLEAGGGQCSY